MLAGIAYFNSLLYKTSIRFYSQHVVTLGRKKGRTHASPTRKSCIS